MLSKPSPIRVFTPSHSRMPTFDPKASREQSEFILDLWNKLQLSRQIRNVESDLSDGGKFTGPLSLLRFFSFSDSFLFIYFSPHFPFFCFSIFSPSLLPTPSSSTVLVWEFVSVCVPALHGYVPKGLKRSPKSYEEKTHNWQVITDELRRLGFSLSSSPALLEAIAREQPGAVQDFTSSLQIKISGYIAHTIPAKVSSSPALIPRASPSHTLSHRTNGFQEDADLSVQLPATSSHVSGPFLRETPVRPPPPPPPPAQGRERREREKDNERHRQTSGDCVLTEEEAIERRKKVLDRFEKQVQEQLKVAISSEWERLSAEVTEARRDGANLNQIQEMESKNRATVTHLTQLLSEEAAIQRKLLLEKLDQVLEKKRERGGTGGVQPALSFSPSSSPSPPLSSDSEPVVHSNLGPHLRSLSSSHKWGTARNLLHDENEEREKGKEHEKEKREREAFESATAALDEKSKKVKRGGKKRTKIISPSPSRTKIKDRETMLKKKQTRPERHYPRDKQEKVTRTDMKDGQPVKRAKVESEKERAKRQRSAENPKKPDQILQKSISLFSATLKVRLVLFIFIYLLVCLSFLSLSLSCLSFVSLSPFLFLSLPLSLSLPHSTTHALTPIISLPPTLSLSLSPILQKTDH